MLSRIALVGVLCAGAAVGAENTPTFTKDVAPVLYKNCVSCHRAGNIAPMPLITYEQVRPWAKAIREKVSLGQMPPWHAEAARGTFLNDRRLSDRERATLVRGGGGGAAGRRKGSAGRAQVHRRVGDRATGRGDFDDEGV